MGTSSPAFQTPQRPPLPNFDKRLAATEAVSAEQKTAAAKLRERLPAARVDFEPLTGAPKSVSAPGDFLSGPGATGKGVSAASAAGFATDDPHRAAKAFLLEHQALFGHGPEALAQARIERDYVTPHNGLRTVVWKQQAAGVPVFEGVFIAHITVRGELAMVCSQFVPAPDTAAEKGTPGSSALLATPPVSAVHAVVLAVGNIGEALAESDLAPEAPGAAGPEKRQSFKARQLKGPAQAGLTWVPLAKDRLRLCWDVIFMSRQRGEMFRTMVDAQSGEVLLRRCLTAYLSDASYRVFTSDSPSPFSPGSVTPSTYQPPLVSRSLVTLPAMDTNASPVGWIDDGGNETRGNNVDAHTDWNSDNLPDLPRPQGSPFRVFDFPMDLTTQDPTNYASAAVVQLFYLCNWYHDKLYELGFTEAAGNFQSNNFARGGVGNDPVMADAQDGSGTDNANFSTPPDGSSGRMQMYIFTGPSPRRDGDFDAEVVFHEHTHGLSWRLVGGGQALGDTQSDGMGEGWSDFYGLCLLSEAGDDVNGNYAAGGYASYKIGGASDLQNYYFGIRRYPYTTDMTKNPLTFKDIDPAQADYCSSSAPYHTGMFGSCSTGSADEVHNEGEVWCVTLWDARANLINKYGWAIGNQLIMQLVTDGMKLTAPHPNFLQARDGILQADVVDNGGANSHELWLAFAKRGMGFSATSPASLTAAGVHESFDLPDDLRVTPLTGFLANGPVGGPFTTNSLIFTLTNAGSNSLSWAVGNPASWLTVLPAGGTLAPAGPSVTVTASLSAAAFSLPAAVYAGTVSFTNLMSTSVATRQFTLRVGQPDFYTELFDGAGSTNDLSFKSFTFTPDGSTSFYSVCRQNVTTFPTDPTGGTTVTLTDDSTSTVTLTGGNTVAIYNTRSGTFYIGSNGYITLNSSDITYTESFAAHFNRPRVSALFDDLNPGTGGTISRRQLSDHVAVTYQAVPEFGTSTQTNTFQIELFFDGRIRVTYLRIKALDGLAGLSAGSGTPANFAPSDLSTYGICVFAPPAITNSPTDQAVLVGANATFTVGASGTVPLSYQWRFYGTNLPSATSSAYTKTSVQLRDAGTYTVVVTNVAGAATGGPAVLTVIASPSIVSQPSNVVTGLGFNAAFGATAAGTAPLGYQWRFNGADIADATTNSLTLLSVQSTNAGSYQLVVTNLYGRATSSVALLTVMDPFIVTQPTNQTVSLAGTASFAVGALGTPLLSYQWLKGGVVVTNGGDLSGATSDTLTIFKAQLADTGVYSVIVSNSNGWVVSSNATLIGAFPPQVVTQPSALRVIAGANAAFAVSAVGQGPLSFQWLQNGTNLTDGAGLSGTTTPSLTLSNVQGADMGFYSVIVSNSFGQAPSSDAFLSVWPLVSWGSGGDVPPGLSNVVGVASGNSHSLALNPDSTVIAWGANTYGQTNVPPGLSNVVALAGGSRHSLALKADGTVTVWGDNAYGQSDVPSGLNNAVAIAAGAYHNLALKADGTIAAWGAGTNNPGLSPRFGQAMVPAGLSNVVGIAAGSYHSLALKADGTVVAWGAGTNDSEVLPRYGQCIVPPGLSNVVAVAAGNYHSLAVKGDGTVAAWGSGAGLPLGWSNVVAAAGGFNFSLGLKSDGTVLAWGNNSSGQATVPCGLSNVVAVTAGSFSALVLEGNAQAPLGGGQIVRATGGAINLSWPALTGRKYLVHFKTALNQPHWIALGSLMLATNTTVSISDTTAADSQRFYRVVLLP